MTNEEIIRAASRSLCIRFGTDAPFAIGVVRGERIGYAAIPCVALDVVCRPCDIPAIVPIVRQRVFAELAERGWADDEIFLSPSVQQGRRCRFTDENESSESHGKQKMGNSHRFSFEMRRGDLYRATFADFGTFKRLPNR